MSLSDAVLTVVAVRLAALVLIGAAGIVLPPHPGLVPRCAPAPEAGLRPAPAVDPAVGEMLAHD